MLTVLAIIGMIAAAMSGALAAGKERMDLFGVAMVGFVTALGGGTLRDVFLDNHPLVWVGEPRYVLLVAVSAVLTVWIARMLQYIWSLFLWLDGIGLVAFSILGAQVAIDKDLGFVIAGVAALVTGAAGGIMRDLLCDRVPLVFRDELYASVSLLAGLGYAGLLELGVAPNVAVTSTLIAGFLLRVLAIQFKITLPVFDYQETYYEDRKALRHAIRALRERARNRAAGKPVPKP